MKNDGIKLFNNFCKCFAGCIIALFTAFFVIFFIGYIGNSYFNNFIDQWQAKSMDFLYAFKYEVLSFLKLNEQRVNQSYTVPKNISIIAIDDTTLNQLGEWPFRRFYHADLLNSFTYKYQDVLREMTKREKIILLDIFFIEQNLKNPTDDIILLESIRANKNVFVDYILYEKPFADKNMEKVFKQRFQYFIEKFKRIEKIYGKTSALTKYHFATFPLIPVMKHVKAMGFANMKADFDNIFRNAKLFAPLMTSQVIESNELQSGEKNYSIEFKGKYIYREKNRLYLKNSKAQILDNTVLNGQVRAVSEADINNIHMALEKQKELIETNRTKYRTTVQKNHDLIKNEIKKIIKKNRKKWTQPSLDILNQILKLSAEYDISLLILNTKKELDSIDKNQVSDDLLLLNKKLNKLIQKTIFYNDEIREMIFQNIPVKYSLIKNNVYFIPSISLSIMANYFNVPINEIEFHLNKGYMLVPDPRIFDLEKQEFKPVKINGKNITSLKIPIDKKGNIFVNLIGKPSNINENSYKHTFQLQNYYKIAKRLKRIDLRNQIFMVGAFSQGMAKDKHHTMLGEMYGIEFLANAVNQMINNKNLDQLPDWLNFSVIFIFSLFIGWIVSKTKIFWSYITSLIIIFFYTFCYIMVFFYLNIILEYPLTVISMILTLTTVIIYRIFTEEKQKKEIKGMFSKYVNPNVVDQLLENPPELGGVDKSITVLFSDVKGFTTLSEMLTPQELVHHLNEYLSAMTDIVFKYEGTLDKYVGDAIMCFWGAPKVQEKHALLACSAALEMMEKLHALNQAWSPERQISIRIGLNSGIMTVGNVGSNVKMNYTLMGDNVNLGSRLEGVNKEYNTNIIISEYTYALVKKDVFVRELDYIRVKGKLKPVVIYELLDSYFKM